MNKPEANDYFINDKWLGNNNFDFQGYINDIEEYCKFIENSFHRSCQILEMQTKILCMYEKDFNVKTTEQWEKWCKENEE